MSSGFDFGPQSGCWHAQECAAVACLCADSDVELECTRRSLHRGTNPHTPLLQGKGSEDATMDSAKDDAAEAGLLPPDAGSKPEGGSSLVRTSEVCHIFPLMHPGTKVLCNLCKPGRISAAWTTLKPSAGWSPSCGIAHQVVLMWNNLY